MCPEESNGYEDEPREHFQPLPDELHHLLYHYERLSHDLQAEHYYYREKLQGKCHRLLELGCGTGLLSKDLQKQGFDVTGIDIDLGALSVLKAASECRLVQMDMCALGFQPHFDAVVIAQNTLNLLVGQEKIRRCLAELKKVLLPSGLILAHLYCSDFHHLTEVGERLMQFQLFDHPEGGKIIKETIRSFDADQQVLLLEQRYKIRRFNADMVDSNYRCVLKLAALTRAGWLEMFESAGYTIESSPPGFSEPVSSPASALHLVARSA